ncbi:hypothetical protein [Streptomyces spirodelae]|uniref:Uncharacterized protein n=1 Tax=Streptomyces spirodelae TaxID=2812904 RepID=A0ABS3WVF6_9ACTN|nr:hypothetical protein [Streptomyces spirodelae]MBO8187094.1 hypothetical protein [Streptomyces spirodelae]
MRRRRGGCPPRPQDAARLKETARDADVHELIEGLPHGCDSIVFKG